MHMTPECCLGAADGRVTHLVVHAAGPFCAIAAVVVVMTTACAPSSVRREIIHEVLTRDNRDLALRDPREVAARFERMATDPLSFFRGSVTLWAQDTTTPGGPEAIASAFVDDVAGGALLIGDPHPENLGTAVTSDGLQFGFNDFDVARFGPVVLDVRRLALGFAVAGQLITASQDATADLVGGVVDGYSDAMSTPLQDILDPTAVPTALDPGTIVVDLFDRARSRGADHREFDDVTTVDGDGQRHLVVTDVAPDDLQAEVLLPLSPSEQVAVDDAVRRAGFSPREMARIVGRGVGSRPLLRWLLLLDDDRLIQLKEARDTFVVPGLVAEHERFFRTNAERVVFARRTMLGHDGADEALRTVDLEPLGAVATSETGFGQTMRVARLMEGYAGGSVDHDDLVAFARVAGRALAVAHRRGVSVDGDVVSDRLPHALALSSSARRAALRDETLAVVAAGVDDALGDHLLLHDLIETWGPLLGLDTVATP